MKKIILLCLTVILMIEVSGCMISGKSKREMAEEHLYNKYGKEFEMVSYESQNIDMPYTQVIFKAESGEMFSVFIEKDDEGNTIIKDGYYGILIQEEYKEMVRGILDEYLTDYKYFSSFMSSYYDDNFDCDYELSNALSDNKHNFYSYNQIFICEDVAAGIEEEVYEKVVTAIKEKGLALYIAVYYVSNEQYQEMDEAEDVEQYILKDYKNRPVFKKTIN